MLLVIRTAGPRCSATVLIGFLSIILVSCSDRKAGEAAPAKVPDLPWGDVAWHAWAERDSARLSGRPILLFLYTLRSYGCREMVRICFRDPRVEQAFRHSTFPVRVDADRRPDLAERYGMGGWPSVVFLSPEGEWITGSTFLDPDDLSRLIRRIRVFYDHPDRLEDLNRARRRLEERSDRRRQPWVRSVAALSQSLLGQLADSIRAAAVRGEDPGPEGLELLLRLGEATGDSILTRDVRAALDRVISGRLRDSDGGFFLAELTPDGAIVDREKHLLRNAGLLSVLTAAGQHTGQTHFLDAAEGLAAFLLNRFYDETQSQFAAGFAGFVEQHEPGQPGRVTPSFEKPASPLLDSSSYAGWNALTVSALLRSYRVVGGDRSLEVSREVMNRLRARMTLPDGGLMHSLVDSGTTPLFLEDQALAARAWLDLYAVGAQPDDLRSAITLADVMIERFADPSGILRDRSPEPSRPYFPVYDRLTPSANGVAAQVLVRLHRLTGDSQYLEAAERILKALIGPHLDRAAYLGALGRGLFDYLHCCTPPKAQGGPE